MTLGWAGRVTPKSHTARSPTNTNPVTPCWVCHGSCRITPLIFHVGPPSTADDMRRIWILAVMQKKRDEFTTQNIAIFRARRLLVRTRFYDDMG